MRFRSLFLVLIFSFIFCSVTAFVHAADTATPASKVLTSKETPSETAVQESTREKNAPAKSKAVDIKSENAEPEKKIEVVEKETKGTVTGTSRLGFAVEYGADENAGGMEIWFNYGDGMKLRGLTQVSEIREGDVLGVVYDETPDHHRAIKEISLISKKANEPEPAANTDEQES